MNLLYNILILKFECSLDSFCVLFIIFYWFGHILYNHFFHIDMKKRICYLENLPFLVSCSLKQTDNLGPCEQE